MRIEIILSLLTATFIAGCSRTDSTQTSDTALSNCVRILAVSPASPAKLRVGELITFKIAYSHTNAGPVFIMTEPFTKGKPVTDYGGAGSPAYPPGTGEGWSHFTILHGPAEVDEVRVLMTDFKTHAVLAQTNMPLHARWE